MIKEVLSLINGEASGLAVPERIEKRWGFERIYHNDEKYCCKLLHINRGPSTDCSLHFHVKKHETLVCVAGELWIDVIINKEPKQLVLKPFEALIVAPGFVHRLYSPNTDTVVIEASTTHFESDSVRIA